jgi:tetratricopeptide (TPR) repeat protein
MQVEVIHVHPGNIPSHLHTDVSNFPLDSLLKFLDDASTLKDQGNERLIAGDPKAAVFKYMHSLQFLDLIRQRNSQNTVENLATSMAARLEKLCTTLHCNLSQAYLNDGLFAKALQEANEALQGDPQLEKALFRKAKALHGMHSTTECIHVLSKLLIVNPSNSAALQLLQAVSMASDDSGYLPPVNTVLERRTGYLALSGDKSVNMAEAVCPAVKELDESAASVRLQPVHFSWWLSVAIGAGHFLHDHCPCCSAAMQRLRKWWNRKEHRA